ncbi:unnamed protein product [Closterium sp. Naga37s-1]|nr:unnamed protein product [Closterium sp. Naga37s-1]
MATTTAARDMEVRLVNGMVLKVQVEEMAGGVGEQVTALEAKLREQGDAMAAMQRDLADMRRAMALLKEMAAASALAEKGSKGSAWGEAAEDICMQPLKGSRENKLAAIEVEEVKARVEAARGEAREAASEMRGEMGALKAELARMRAAAERQAAEVAYVKATAAHSEARINDVELALAARKDGKAGGEGVHAGAERREGKRRKSNEVGDKGGMEDALISNGGAVVEKRDEADRDGEANGRENGAACDTEAKLQGIRARVEALEKTSAGGSKTWEGLQKIAADAKDVQELIRDTFPQMIVTPGREVVRVHGGLG